MFLLVCLAFSVMACDGNKDKEKDTTENTVEESQTNDDETVTTGEEKDTEDKEQNTEDKEGNGMEFKKEDEDGTGFVGFFPLIPQN